MKKFKEFAKDYLIPCTVIAIVSLGIFLGVAKLCDLFM